jgi:hypothetical protein
MKIVSIRGDGNCLYRALAQAYHVAMTGALLSSEEEDERAADLRLHVAAYVEAHPEIVKLSRDFVEQRESNRKSFQNVAHNVAKKIARGRWAEELEVRVSQKILGNTIIVYNERGTEIKNIFEGSEPPLKIAYIDDTHYQLLVPNRTVGLNRVTVLGNAPDSLDPLSSNESKGLRLKLYRNVYRQSYHRLGANQHLINQVTHPSMSLDAIEKYYHNIRPHLIDARATNAKHANFLHANDKYHFILDRLNARAEHARAMRSHASMPNQDVAELATHAATIKKYENDRGRM